MLSKSIKDKVKGIVYQQLPVTELKPSPLRDSGEIYLTIALKRSGQHTIINWFCLQLKSAIHINECVFIRKDLSMMIASLPGRFVTYNNQEKIDTGYTGTNKDKKLLGTFFSKVGNVGSYPNIIYSFEDTQLDDFYLKRFIHKYKPKVILIMRDPYNCLASCFKHREGKNTLADLREKKYKLITYLEQSLEIEDYLKYPVLSINFNQWLISKKYRQRILESLGIPFDNKLDDISLEEIPSFGGGSSFEGKEFEANKLKNRVFERWKSYASNTEYKNLLDDQYLSYLSQSIFDFEKPF